MTAAAAPLGVYVHIPFCVRKCRYCAFNSYPIDPSLAERYVRALLLEIEAVGYEVGRGRHAATLYIGGGTPTSIGAEALASVISRCVTVFGIAPGSEISVECNPGTIDGDDLRLLLDAGVNRLSVGAQAFQDDLLARLGRIHCARDIHDVVRNAREAGFANINLDLMFGLPGQDMSDWEESLRRAVNLEPEHVSAYPLELEEGTPLCAAVARGEENIPPEETVVEMWESALDLLVSSGYERYEVSNYAKPGRECRHNITYWENGDYVGLGAGAASHLDGRRCSNVALPVQYCELVEAGRRPLGLEERHTAEDEMVDTVLMGLRLARGLDIDAFRRRFGRDIHDAFPGALERLAALGLIVSGDGAVRLSESGFFVANAVFREFVPTTRSHG